MSNWESLLTKKPTLTPNEKALTTIKGYTIQVNKSGGIFFRHPDGMAKSINMPQVSGLYMLKALGADDATLTKIASESKKVKTGAI